MIEGGWAKHKTSGAVGYVLALDKQYAHILWDGGQVELVDSIDLENDSGPRTVHSSLHDSLEYGSMEDGSLSDNMLEARKEAIADVLPLLHERLARDTTVRASLARVEDQVSRDTILQGIANRALYEYLEEVEE